MTTPRQTHQWDQGLASANDGADRWIQYYRDIGCDRRQMTVDAINAALLSTQQTDSPLTTISNLAGIIAVLIGRLEGRDESSPPE